MSKRRNAMASLAVAAALGLVGCNGDHHDDTTMTTPPSTAVPDSASVSSAAFVSYLQTLSTTDESSEPLTIKTSFAVPPDDTSEPATLR